MTSDGETHATETETERAAETTIQPETDPFLSLKRGATEVYLVRHADALPGADEVVGGRLRRAGVERAGAASGHGAGGTHAHAGVGRRLQQPPIGRAHQTAAAIADLPPGWTCSIEPDLREIRARPHCRPDLSEHAPA